MDAGPARTKQGVNYLNLFNAEQKRGRTSEVNAQIRERPSPEAAETPKGKRLAGRSPLCRF